MKTVALTAHFDGEKVQFDERQAWSRFSAGQLAKAYGDHEPEYTAADLRSHPSL